MKFFEDLRFELLIRFEICQSLALSITVCVAKVDGFVCKLAHTITYQNVFEMNTAYGASYKYMGFPLLSVPKADKSSL